MSSDSDLKSEFENSSQKGYDSIFSLNIFQIYKYIGSPLQYDAESFVDFIDINTKILESSKVSSNWITNYFSEQDTPV